MRQARRSGSVVQKVSWKRIVLGEDLLAYFRSLPAARLNLRREHRAAKAAPRGGDNATTCYQTKRATGLQGAGEKPVGLHSRVVAVTQAGSFKQSPKDFFSKSGCTYNRNGQLAAENGSL
jgi:hypothetical protein